MKTNLEIYKNMVINPASVVKNKVRELMKYKSRYESVCKNIDWYIIAILHYRESNNDFSKWLAQGDKIIKDKPTINVPKGLITKLGTWEDAAIISLNYDKMYSKNWDNLENILNNFESWNGLGYRKNNRVSPYLFSFTNQYTSGKYIEDGKYSSTAKDAQIGAAALLYYFKNPDRLS